MRTRMARKVVTFGTSTRLPKSSKYACKDLAFFDHVARGDRFGDAFSQEYSIRDLESAIQEAEAICIF